MTGDWSGFPGFVCKGVLRKTDETVTVAGSQRVRFYSNHPPFAVTFRIDHHFCYRRAYELDMPTAVLRRAVREWGYLESRGNGSRVCEIPAGLKQMVRDSPGNGKIHARFTRK